MHQPTPYLSDPDHQSWPCHYDDDQRGDRTCRLLLYSKSWAYANLPAPWSREAENADTLDVTLIDTQTGQRYPVTMPYFAETVMLPWGDGWAMSLQAYMYAGHFCTCHRAAALERHGVETDGECEGTRFVVERVTPEGRPNLVLYSETLDVEELERMLADD